MKMKACCLAPESNRTKKKDYQKTLNMNGNGRNTFKSILLLLGLCASGLVVLFCLYVCGCFFYVVWNLGDSAVDRDVRMYELDGMVLKRVNKDGNIDLYFIEDNEEVDKVSIGYKDLSSWLLTRVYFQDGTVLVAGDKITRPLLYKRKAKRIYTESEEEKRQKYESILNVWALEDSLMKQGRCYRFENVLPSKEDSLYNRDTLYPTKVKMTVLGKDGTVKYTNYDLSAVPAL
jgi:hypothetical protein